MEIQGIEFALQAIDADMTFYADDVVFNYSLTAPNNLKNDSFSSKGLKLFPNPVNDQLIVSGDETVIC